MSLTYWTFHLGVQKNLSTIKNILKVELINSENVGLSFNGCIQTQARQPAVNVALIWIPRLPIVKDDDSLILYDSMLSSALARVLKSPFFFRSDQEHCHARIKIFVFALVSNPEVIWWSTWVLIWALHSCFLKKQKCYWHFQMQE